VLPEIVIADDRCVRRVSTSSQLYLMVVIVVNAAYEILRADYAPDKRVSKRALFCTAAGHSKPFAWTAATDSILEKIISPLRSN
jgi:hypothetical protein